MMADPDARRLLSGLKEIVKRAWQTMAQMRDPDARFQTGEGNAWPLQVVREWSDYNTTPVKLRFKPTARDVTHMEVVMTWMAWLRRTEGEGSIRRIVAWAKGVPVWMIAQREECSDKTILNRIDRSMGAVLGQFLATPMEIEPIDEPVTYRGENLVAWASEAATPDRSAPGSSSTEPGKVWIDGLGYMFKGKPWNNGERLADPRGRGKRQRYA